MTQVLLIIAGVFALIAIALLWVIVRSRKDAGRFAYNVSSPQFKEVPMLELNCTNEEKIKVIVAPMTSTGKPASLDGESTVTIQSGSGTVELLDPGDEFYLISGDTPGDTTYLVEADADLGSGVETISEIVVLHVAGAKAANLGLTAGSPEAK